jgi:hypothetical protein
MKNSKIKNSGLFIAICIFTLHQNSAQAAEVINSAQEGLARIKSNLNNSKSNLSSYENNLNTVESNLQEIAKAKNQIEEQQKQLNKVDEENKKAMITISTQEKELNLLIIDEKTKNDLDAKKITELEMMISKMKATQQKRDENINAYQQQLLKAQEEKRIWQSRIEGFNVQKSKVTQNSKSIQKEESEWQAKRLGYKAEVNRWNAEVQRQQKINDSYTSLAEVK